MKLKWFSKLLPIYDRRLIFFLTSATIPLYTMLNTLLLCNLCFWKTSNFFEFYYFWASLLIIMLSSLFSSRWRRLTAQWPTRRISASKLWWPRGTQLTSRLFSLLPCIQVMQLTFPLVKIHEQTQGVRWHKARFPLNHNLCFFGTKQGIKIYFTVWLQKLWLNIHGKLSYVNIFIKTYLFVSLTVLFT